jgi:hypothetical protein
MDQDIRDTVGQRRLRRSSREVGCADEHFHSDGAVVDLDAVQSGRGLDGLLVLVEDDCRTAQATTGGAVLEQDLLGPADTDSRSEVFLLGGLVVVTR